MFSCFVCTNFVFTLTRTTLQSLFHHMLAFVRWHIVLGGNYQVKFRQVEINYLKSICHNIKAKNVNRFASYEDSHSFLGMSNLDTTRTVRNFLKKTKLIP